MKISCRENNSNFILKLHSSILTFDVVSKLQFFLKDVPSSQSIALNLSDVDFICVEFLDFLKETSRNRIISLTNIQAEILVLLNLTNYDKFAPLFITDNDFLEQKRPLINRRFSIV